MNPLESPLLDWCKYFHINYYNELISNGFGCLYSLRNKDSVEVEQILTAISSGKPPLQLRQALRKGISALNQGTYTNDTCDCHCFDACYFHCGVDRSIFLNACSHPINASSQTNYGDDNTRNMPSIDIGNFQIGIDDQPQGHCDHRDQGDGVFSEIVPGHSWISNVDEDHGHNWAARAAVPQVPPTKSSVYRDNGRCTEISQAHDQSQGYNHQTAPQPQSDNAVPVVDYGGLENQGIAAANEGSVTDNPSKSSLAANGLSTACSRRIFVIATLHYEEMFRTSFDADISRLARVTLIYLRADQMGGRSVQYFITESLKSCHVVLLLMSEDGCNVPSDGLYLYAQDLALTLKNTSHVDLQLVPIQMSLKCTIPDALKTFSYLSIGDQYFMRKLIEALNEHHLVTEEPELIRLLSLLRVPVVVKQNVPPGGPCSVKAVPAPAFRVTSFDKRTDFEVSFILQSQATTYSNNKPQIGLQNQESLVQFGIKVNPVQLYPDDSVHALPLNTWDQYVKFWTHQTDQKNGDFQFSAWFRFTFPKQCSHKVLRVHVNFALYAQLKSQNRQVPLHCLHELEFLYRRSQNKSTSSAHTRNLIPVSQDTSDDVAPDNAACCTLLKPSQPVAERVFSAAAYMISKEYYDLTRQLEQYGDNNVELFFNFANEQLKLPQNQRAEAQITIYIKMSGVSHYLNHLDDAFKYLDLAKEKLNTSKLLNDNNKRLLEGRLYYYMSAVHRVQRLFGLAERWILKSLATLKCCTPCEDTAKAFYNAAKLYSEILQASNRNGSAQGVLQSAQNYYQQANDHFDHSDVKQITRTLMNHASTLLGAPQTELGRNQPISKEHIDEAKRLMNLIQKNGQYIVCMSTRSLLQFTVHQSELYYRKYQLAAATGKEDSQHHLAHAFKNMQQALGMAGPYKEAQSTMKWAEFLRQQNQEVFHTDNQLQNCIGLRSIADISDQSAASSPESFTEFSDDEQSSTSSII